jgi:hypothetical protein
MKTIEVKIKKQTEEIATFELPIYFKIDTAYFSITEKSKVVKVETYESCEHIIASNYPENHLKDSIDIITKEEFMEKFETVSQIINGYLL